MDRGKRQFQGIVTFFTTYWKYPIILLSFLIGGTIAIFVFQTTWGIRGEYYSNPSWEGQPVVSRIDKFPFLRGSMGKELLSTNSFSVRWSGWILIKVSGMYQFATNSDDGSSLWIDGKMIIDNGGPHGLKKKSNAITLEKGVYPFEVLYFQAGGFSVVEALWTPPNQEEQRISAEYLFAHSPGRTEVLLRKGGSYFIQFVMATWGFLFFCLFVMGVRVSFQTYQIKLTWRFLLICVFCGITFWVTYFSPVDYSGFDPLGNLLTAQSIVRQGTLKLDSYADTLPTIGYHNGWHLHEKNGHLYYYFPIGTPLYSIPFVWLANWYNADMIDRMDDAALQNLLSAITTTLSAWLIYCICRWYVCFSYSVLFSSAFVFGSSITSTMGTGLHSINYTVVFELLCLLIVIPDKDNDSDQINPYLLGMLLFSAYLCRPSSAIFVGLILLYVLLKRRRVFVKLMITCLLLFGILVVFSWTEYRNILPDYYLPTRLSNTTISWFAFYANLFSPSRGVFVFSPYLLLSLFGGVFFFRRLLRLPLFWLSISWALLQFITIAKFHHWWGGGSHGNRLFADTFPALIVLTLLVWREALIVLSPLLRRTALGLFFLLALVGIFVNTYQGLYNTYTVDWGDQVDDLLNWRYPQFLASHQLLAERDIYNQAKTLIPYEIGEIIEPQSHAVIFSSWYWIYESPYGKSRWSRGPSAQILFTLPAFEFGEQDTLFIEMSLGAYQEQQVEVLFNEQQIGSLTHRGEVPSTYVFPVKGSQFRWKQNQTNTYNIIEFRLPDAVNPGEIVGKGWILAKGISFFNLVIHPEIKVTEKVLTIE